MPYNTRRKSLSLPQLGIPLPGSGARGAHRSPPAAIKEEPSTDEPSLPPAKRTKRSHTTSSHSSSAASSASPPPPRPSSQPSSRPNVVKHEGERSRVAQHTPPPSPGATSGFKIDTQGIDDDIVVGVIEQLEKTGNRPHLLKELAAVLSNTLPAVERSANPSAIISSRLSSYLSRAWTPLAPCPVGKQLIGTHPKRLFFYLTNQPHQPFPEPADINLINNNAARIISPSLSSAADDEDIDIRKREELSPSPEIDLSNPEFEAHATNNDGFRASSEAHSDLTNRHNETPPLERDEREFTQTVTSLQARSRSQSIFTTADITMEDRPEIPIITEDSVMHTVEETEEFAAQRNSETAAALFGQANGPRATGISAMDFASSPMIKPTLGIDAIAANKPGHLDIPVFSANLDNWSWNDIKSPETVGLDELDDLFASY